MGRLRAWCLASSGLCSAVLAGLDTNGDFQIWNRYEVFNQFLPNWSCTTRGEWRWGDNASILFLMYGQWQIAYRPVPCFEIAPTYRQIWFRLNETSKDWRPNYYPFLETTLYIDQQGWQIQSRNRVVYQTAPGDPMHWIERNRLRLISPWYWTPARLNFFIDNEVFFGQGRSFYEDRASAGFLMPFHEHVEVDLFYMCRFAKRPVEGWVHVNVLKIFLKAAF